MAQMLAPMVKTPTTPLNNRAQAVQVKYTGAFLWRMVALVSNRMFRIHGLQNSTRPSTLAVFRIRVFFPIRIRGVK